MTHPHATIDRGPTLLLIARGAIAEKLGMAGASIPAAGWLDEPGASFVTLKRHGSLRGCVGTLVPVEPLGEDVASNARAAAFQDSRFPPLSVSEWPDTDIEVSVLSPLEPIRYESKHHLLTLLRPHVDGLVMEWEGHKGAFLPQVWDQVADPAAFLVHLTQKAGLPQDFWDDQIRISRFTVARFHEEAGVGSRR